MFQILLPEKQQEVQEQYVYVSECENFVVCLWRREFQNAMQYKTFIYSLFEEHLIHETEWMAANPTLKLEE